MRVTQLGDKGQGVTYLVTFGLSAHHGSELAVGWQWYQRLRKSGPVTVLAHAVFAAAEFIPDSARCDIVFLCRPPREPQAVNQRHAYHVYRFWVAVLRYLRCHSRREDRVVIASPAAAWFLPLVLGIPVPREGVYYGPVGVDRIDLARCASPRIALAMLARNVAVTALSAAWRAFAPWLPASVSFRWESGWFLRRIGPRYRTLGSIPEVEPPPLDEYPYKTTLVGSASARREFLVLFDSRPRKQFSATISYAMTLARRCGGRILVFGASPRVAAAIERRCTASGLDVEVHPRCDRASFRRILATRRPSIVSLSLSDGVPSLFIEALVAGCEVVSYAAGGVSWLERFASCVDFDQTAAGEVRVIRWDRASYEEFRTYVRQGFAALLRVIGETATENSQEEATDSVERAPEAGRADESGR